MPNQDVGAETRWFPAELALETDRAAEQGREADLEISSSRKMSTTCLNTLEEPLLSRTSAIVRCASALRADGRSRATDRAHPRVALQRAARSRIGPSVLIMLSASTRLQSRQPTRSAAFVRDLSHRVRWREPLMYGEDIADFWRAGILPCLATGSVRRGGASPRSLRETRTVHRVPQALGHLGLTVETQHPLRVRQQRLRLGKEVVA